MFALDDKIHVTQNEIQFWNKLRNFFADTCGVDGDQCRVEVAPTYIKYTRFFARLKMRNSFHINRLTGSYLGYSISLKPEDARDPQISRTVGSCEKIANPAAQVPKF